MNMVDIESEYKLIKEEKDIVTKVNKLNQLSYDVRYISPSRSFEIAEESRKLSQQTKNRELEAISKMNMGFAKFLMSDDFPILKY